MRDRDGFSVPRSFMRRFPAEARALFLMYLDELAQDLGEFVHHNRKPLYSDPCPFCGCRSYFAFSRESVVEPENPHCSHSDPDDAFECAGCGAVAVRRDLSGDFPYWQTIDAMKKKRRKGSPKTGGRK